MSETIIFGGIVLIGVSVIAMVTYIDGLKFKISSAETDASYWKRMAEINQEHLDESFKSAMERINNDS